MKPQSEAGSAKEDRKILRSEEIFGGSREVVIKHNEDYYRLLITKAGKLILNK